MSKGIQIIELGNPLLRKKAASIKNIQYPDVKKTIKNLKTIVKKVNGVGLAAPQLGKSYQIFIMASYPNKRYPKAPKMKPTIIINPKILSHSKKVVKDWEGCLSVPGIRGLVPRYQSVKVEYTKTNGEKERKEFKGFITRIFQHEYDHLKGIVFLDRLKNVKDIITDKEYFKLIKKYEKK